ncbi:glutathione S-transferase family protein [Phenylobacterium sp.]|uniref:glutathione S-transferase family protein n=1 Tax=Phenylobacterium sp. TaxID=1871053 RepID=UPI002732A630|nr:glutathione S-transferase [Phenylobacterium sp.]MDP3659535.1 glutathione S-transferase [Phenylobacterium sp.]
MKLYDASGAPNPRRVRWFLAEKGVSDLAIAPVNIMIGEHKQPGYVAKAGFAHAPALEIDDEVTITESVAICRYLESIYPEPNMFGRTPKETAVIEMWTRRAEHLVAVPLMLGVRHTHPALAVLEKPNPAVAEYNTQYGLDALKVFDAQLSGREWLAADRLTIADIVAFVGLDFARLIKLRPPAELVELNRWAQAMRDRPAAKASQ